MFKKTMCCWKAGNSSGGGRVEEVWVLYNTDEDGHDQEEGCQRDRRGLVCLVETERMYWWKDAKDGALRWVEKEKPKRKLEYVVKEKMQPADERKERAQQDESGKGIIRSDLRDP